MQKFANDTPVGTGPYTFGEWKHGQTVSVNRNDSFWGTPPGPAAILWVLYQNEDVMAQSLKAGEVDILPEVPPTIYDGLGTNGGLKPVSLPGFSFHHIGMNVSTASDSKGNPLLLQKEVRQALGLRDRPQPARADRAGRPRQAGRGPAPAGARRLPAAARRADQELNANPDKANQLLDGLGYTIERRRVRETSDGQPLEFRLIAIESTTVDVRAAQLFKDSCAKVGIKMDLTTMDENTLGNIVYKHDRLGPVRVGLGLGRERPGLPAGRAAHDRRSGATTTSTTRTRSTTTCTRSRPPSWTCRSGVDLVHQTQQLFYDDSAYIVMWYQDKLQAYRSDLWTGFADTPGGIIFNFTRANYTNATPV